MRDGWSRDDRAGLWERRTVDRVLTAWAGGTWTIGDLRGNTLAVGRIATAPGVPVAAMDAAEEWR